VVEKKGRPAPLSRRTTPQYATKVGAGWSGGKSTRERDREEDGVRDSGESFPQFWYVLLFFAVRLGGGSGFRNGWGGSVGCRYMVVG